MSQRAHINGGAKAFGLAMVVVYAVIASTARVGRAVPPPAPDALTEFSAASWDGEAQYGTIADIFDDTTLVQVGSASIRFETDGGFDTWLWSPPTRDAGWDLSGVTRLRLWVYAVNNNIGFQNRSPWIRLGSGDLDYWEFYASYDILNDARNQWLELDIPLSGNSLWTRADIGTVAPSAIQFIEIHADTWDHGFTLWVDGLTFDTTPALPDGLAAIAGDNKVSLTWRAYGAPPAFSHFAVYRDTAPFTSVAGLTPLTTIANAAATSYDDATAVNGTSYYYAVTAVATGGAEEMNVAALGPRTPRHETDLHVLYIERTPEYPRYWPFYSYYEVTEPSGFGPYAFTAATDLSGGQDEFTQRFPNSGDTVTYTAHVRNRGTTTVAGPIACTWRYDGGVIGSASLPGPLAPNDTVTTSVNRVWDGQPHEIAFSIDLADDRLSNNAVADDTNGVGFLSYIDRSFEERFRELTSQYPEAYTADFVEWLQHHMTRMNEMFADAGARKRARYDRLEIIDDQAPDPNVDTIPWAVFPFRYRAGDGDIRLSGYYSAADDIDYGLLHEMGHQLGLIDLYRLDMSPDNNLVSGVGYLATAGLMHGCSPFFSTHSALAMEHWYDKAHGYFGQYLYSLPDTVRMRFLGADGLPLANATVKMYQKVEVPGVGEVIPNQIKAQGTTNSNGEWDLPNVPIDTNMVPTTFAGDTLGPNPFGYVAVVGTNGLLHFRVEKGGAIDYAWLDITEVNVAYWQGQTSTAVFERQVALGGPVQHYPPADMTENNANDWSAWAEGSDATNTYVLDETAAGMHPVGEASLKFVTDGGFDTYVRYPRTFAGQWNLSQTNSLTMHVYAVNPNLGFQNGSPWVRLKDGEGGFFEYKYHAGGWPYDLLNQAIGRWQTLTIPLGASPDENDGWRRSTFGSPDLSDIRSIEIHADTWGGGFTLWLDGVGFDPPLVAFGDLDHDGDVDLSDFGGFLTCFNGPNRPPGQPNCEAIDSDSDNDVDLADFSVFLTCFNGPNRPPPC